MIKKLQLSDNEKKLILCLRETDFEAKTLLEMVKENVGKNHAQLTKKLGNEKDNFMIQIMQTVVAKYNRNFKTVESYLNELE